MGFDDQNPSNRSGVPLVDSASVAECYKIYSTGFDQHHEAVRPDGWRHKDLAERQGLPRLV